MTKIITAEGLTLTDDEQDAAIRVARRLNATKVSLYRTSEGLRAFVVDAGGGEHLGVKVV